MCHTLATTKLTLFERKDEQHTEDGDLDKNATLIARDLQNPDKESKKTEVNYLSYSIYYNNCVL